MPVTLKNEHFFVGTDGIICVKLGSYIHVWNISLKYSIICCTI